MLKGVVLTCAGVAIGAAVFAKYVTALFDRAGTRPQAAAATTSRTPPAPAAGQGCQRGEAFTLHADRDGHFQVQAEIDGRLVPMVVDTGATRIVLPAEEARRVGLDLGGARRVPVQTANGVIEAELVRANRFKLGPICLSAVDVLVMPPGRLTTGLLGMNVIGSLARFDMSRTRLILAH